MIYKKMRVNVTEGNHLFPINGKVYSFAVTKYVAFPSDMKWPINGGCTVSLKDLEDAGIG